MSMIDLETRINLPLLVIILFLVDLSLLTTVIIRFFQPLIFLSQILMVFFIQVLLLWAHMLIH